MVRAPVALTCAGRTDAGVHALDQVVHFDVPGRAVGRDSTRPRWCRRATASWARPSWSGRPRWPPTGFDARRSATARRYRYLVVNAPVADPLLAGLAWHVADPLDLRAMAAASDALLGEHDFRAFCRVRAPPPTTRPRRVPSPGGSS